MSIDWRRGDTPISKLNLTNFSEFVEAYTDFTYRLAYKATGSEKSAEEISKKTFERVMIRESVESGSDEVYPETGIRHAMVSLLSHDQIERMDDERADVSIMPPKPEVCDRILEEAYDNAEKKVPRYAPTFTGTTGTIVILSIVACIIAAIALVWLAPGASVSKSDGTIGNSAIAVDAAGDINADLMIDVSSAVMPRNADDVGFNSGVVPVQLSISGPDLGSITDVNIHNDSVNAALYQCGRNEYCYFAQTGSTYEANIVGAGGSSVSSYAYIPSIEPAADAVTAAPNACIAVSHSGTGELNFMSDVIVTKAPGKCDCVMIGGNSVGLTPNGKEDSIGVDSITVMMAGGTDEIVVPIIIYDNEPAIDKGTLSTTLMHTPCHSGNSAGRIIVSDEDGDTVNFKLTDSKGCVAILAPSGSYMVHINDDYRDAQASFSFTVSDGRIESDEYTMVFNLENKLITTTEYSQSFVCYSGEDGYYKMNLPETDEDGDKLMWSLISTADNGVTPNGSTVRFSKDDSVVEYRIDPTVNKDFTEVLEFTCTDGWITSGTVTVTCHIAQNAPPRSGGGNFVSMEASLGQIVCTLHVADDCEFDECTITGWKNAVGGSVVESVGWKDLQFTFVPDGSVSECTVDMLVTDTLSGAVGTITYTIFVK